MRAEEIESYLRSLRGAGPYPEPDVDTFKAGNPLAEVTGIAVGWMSYTWALEKALELGCNLFITHEPTYYDHLDTNREIFRLPGVAAKRTFIEDAGLAVLRCHDLWDMVGEIGIPDSWGRYLGLGAPDQAGRYLRAYEIEAQEAHSFAAGVAERLAPLGQPGVQLLGPAERIIRRVGTGTGAITPVTRLIEEYRVDAVVATDDGIDYWRDGALSIDLGFPIVVVNHPVSELAGMEMLAGHLKAVFPQIPVHHIPQRCMYQLIPSGPEG